MNITDLMKNWESVLGFLTGLVLLTFLAGVAFRINHKIFTDPKFLTGLISESDGKASMSRLQLLIFTFVIAMSFFYIVVGSGDFPKNFPPEVLVLLGISTSTALVSKSIQMSGTSPGLVIAPASAGPIEPGKTVSLSVTLSNAPAGNPLPQVTWSLDAPANGTIEASPPDKATYTAPDAKPGDSAGRRVTVRVVAAGFDDGTATITLA